MDVPRTRDEIQQGLDSLTHQIRDGLQKGRYTLSELQDALKTRTQEAAHSTDEMVRENPWSALGIGVAIGLLIGLTIPRR